MKLKQILKAKDSSEISLDDIRQQVSTLANEDGRFKGKSEGEIKVSGQPWTNTILFKDGDWAAVIYTPEQKLFEVGFTIEKGQVTKLHDDAKEVRRKETFVEASEPFMFNSEAVTDEAGEVVKCGAPAGNKNAAGKHDILSERENAHAAQKAVFTSPNHEVAAPFGQKASDAANKASKIAAINNSEHANLHAGRAHTHAREAHEELAMLSPDKKTEKFHNGEAAKHGALEAEHLTAIGIKAKGTVGIPTQAKEDEFEFVHCTDAGSPISTEKKWEFGKPIDFMWLPGGLSCVTAGCRDRSLRMWVVADKSSAKEVQKQFSDYVSASPRRLPFGCIEHQEMERAFEPKKFAWKETPEPGIYCTAVPSKLGEENVNGKLQTSFSPCFRHDARFSSAVCEDCKEKASICECGGTLYFADGVRGSEKNPAKVVGIAEKSVGSLTNWPAFKDILPVTAKEPDKEISRAKEGEEKKSKHAEKARENATEAYHAMNLSEIDPKNAGDHAAKAAGHAEKATESAADAKESEKGMAHYYAGKAHEHAATAQMRGGKWQQESHHRLQSELHRRYANAAKDENHPEYSRAMNFKATEPNKPDAKTVYASCKPLNRSYKKNPLEGLKPIGNVNLPARANGEPASRTK